MKERLIQHFEEMVTEKRNNLFNTLLKERTRYITVVLEDIYQPHNASAVLRTCDCCGIQDVHIIENRNEYRINPDVTLGSDKWLHIEKYNKEENNSLAAIKTLKSKGYRIVATTPHRNDTELNNLDLEKGKIALLFGSELNGLTEEALQESDEFVKIPMFGFTESFNISVSAAIILHQLILKIREAGISWSLTRQEMDELKLDWLRKSVKNSDRIEAKFLACN